MESVRRDIQFYPVIFFIFFLLIAVFLQNTRLPTKTAYAITAAAYVLIPVLLFTYNDFTFDAKKLYFILFFCFSLIVLLRTAIDPTISDLLRLLTLLSFTLANFFILPHIIPFQTFLRILTRTSAVLVLIGLLPLFGFPSDLGMIDLSLWGTFSEYNITIITSIFVNPNQLGALALIGTIAALEERLTTPTAGVGLLFGINVFGLFLSHYRTGWIALISSMGLFIIYSMWGRRALVFATVGGIFTIAIGLLMTFSIVPGPTAFSEISLNGRRELWTTSAHAFRERLWIGHGFAGTQEIVGNPHNSYLRMFASFGVIGGMIYTILVIGTAVGSARQTRTYRRVTLTAIIVSMLIVQIFNQLSFVGISMRSSLIAIFMGYYMTCTEL